MASKVLPQALITIPRIPSQCPTKRLGFSTALSRRPSAATSARVSVARVSSSSLGSRFGPLFARRDFVVRADSTSEGEAAESSEESVEVVAEAVAESSEESVEVVAEAVAESSEESVEVVAEAVAESSEEGVEVVAEAEAEGEEEPRPPRKQRVKLGDVMGILNKRAVEASENERPIPDIRTGDVVQIKLEVPENRRRLSIYKGIVISRQNAGIHTTIRVRRIIAGVGVEIVFPLYSPNIKEIRVVSHRKVRRARLYYLRDKLPRLSTFK